MLIRTILMGIGLNCLWLGALQAVDELPTAHFKCGKEEVMADFHDNSKLDLTIGTRTYLLSVVMSGSGAKYETPKGSKPHVMFWNKGSEATIEIDKHAFPLCHQTKAPINKHLSFNKEWHVAEVNGKKLIKGSRLVVTLSDKGEISGFSGCNRFSGHYELHAENLTIKGPLVSTEMACVKDGMMKQESHFMSLLHTMKYAKIFDGKDLVLSNDNGQSIKMINK